MLGMSRSEREKYADENLSTARLARASLNYASTSGLLGNIFDVGGAWRPASVGTAARH